MKTQISFLEIIFLKKQSLVAHMLVTSAMGTQRQPGLRGLLASQVILLGMFLVSVTPCLKRLRWVIPEKCLPLSSGLHQTLQTGWSLGRVFFTSFYLTFCRELRFRQHPGGRHPAADLHEHQNSRRTLASFAINTFLLNSSPVQSPSLVL